MKKNKIISMALCFFVFLGAAALTSATPTVDGLIGDTPGVLDASEYGGGALHYFTQDVGPDEWIGTLYKTCENGVCYFAFVYNPDVVNDNSYAPKGTKLLTWQTKNGDFKAEGNEHKFGDLLGSDHLKARIHDGLGNEVLDFRIDLIAMNDKLTPMYASCGHYKPYSDYQDKCEADVMLGDPAMILDSATSTEWNINNSGYPVTTNKDDMKSPDIDYDLYLETGEYVVIEPTASDPYPWEFMMIYEWKINASVLEGNGLGEVEIHDVHNSPYKIYTGPVVPVYEPEIDLVKTASEEFVFSGTSVDYIYTITNTGNVHLTDITLTDDKIESIDCEGVTELAPGESMICTGMYEIEICTQNFANVTGIAPDGTTVLDEDDELVCILCPEPCINITKDGPEEWAVSSSPLITYTFTVGNCGNVDLSNVFVIDPILGLNHPIDDLEAFGESTTFSANYTINPLCDCPSLENTAIAFGEYGPITVADWDDHTVNCVNGDEE